MRVAVIVQARMGSSRLPGKVMAPVLGRPLLAYQLERLAASTGAHAFVVATTWEPRDDAIADLARSMGWTVVRGSEKDVLSRYLLAANAVDADAILRSTADCPLIDPATVDSVIERFLWGDVAHVEVSGLPDGMGVEIFTTAALRDLAGRLGEQSLTAADREHVSLYIRRHPETYRRAVVDTGFGFDSDPLPRWTVDTAEDLELVTEIIEALAPSHPIEDMAKAGIKIRLNGVGPQRPMPLFHVADILALFAEHPDWWAINGDIHLPPLDQELLEATRLWKKAPQWNLSVNWQPDGPFITTPFYGAGQWDTASCLGSAEYTLPVLDFAPIKGDL